MTNYHKQGLIKPEYVYKACEYLVQHHPEYKDIKIMKYDDEDGDNVDLHDNEAGLTSYPHRLSESQCT